MEDALFHPQKHQDCLGDECLLVEALSERLSSGSFTLVAILAKSNNASDIFEYNLVQGRVQVTLGTPAALSKPFEGPNPIRFLKNSVNNTYVINEMLLLGEPAVEYKLSSSDSAIEPVSSQVSFNSATRELRVNTSDVA